FCLIGTASLSAQTADSLKADGSGKNLVKVNLTAIPLKNYSFQYERAIGKKISAVIGFRFMPESGLPFKSSFESIIDDEDTWKYVDQLKTGNTAITPELRFYMGKSVFRGFYIAPFARFASYSAELPSFEFDYEHPVEGSQTETIPLSGNLKTITGGLLFGAQWKLSKLVYLDWWILGPQYGTAKGDISGKKQLSAEEQTALREELEGLDIPLVDTKTTVDQNGAKVDFS